MKNQSEVTKYEKNEYKEHTYGSQTSMNETRQSGCLEYDPLLICHRCGNTDPAYFARNGSILYCRKCVSFGALEVGADPKPVKLCSRKIDVIPKLKFELTPAQANASRKVLQALQAGKDVFVYAAAGAGKTEMSLESICWYMKQGKKVCFAISRRQVVMEIAARMQEIFPNLSVIAVCQGHTKVLDGDLIVCTTHQLFRYPKCFDLLILDEMDAFPFVDHPVLQQISRNSCKGQRMLLSATPDEKSMQDVQVGRMEMVTLFQRPHGKPLCVPKVIRTSSWSSLLRIIQKCRKYEKEGKQVLVFVPRKADGIWMTPLLNLFVRTELIHSDIQNKDAIMACFHSKQTQALVCTTLLERGITVGSVQVLVYHAEHSVFTKASFIQIFGRVGRAFADPQGDGICYCSYMTKEIEGCIEQLNWMNAIASNFRD